MKQIGLALHHYHQDHGRFPPAVVYSPDGRPLHSWRVLILPYMDQQALYQKFRLDEPWDSPHNRELLARRPSAYDPVGVAVGRTMTYSQVFNGVGTVFEGRDGVAMGDIRDGTHETLAVVEAWEPVPWTRPIDLPYVSDAQLPPLGGVFQTSKRPYDAHGTDGFTTLFADGTVRYLKKKMPETTLRKLITRDGGERISADEY